MPRAALKEAEDDRRGLQSRRRPVKIVQTWDQRILLQEGHRQGDQERCEAVADPPRGEHPGQARGVGAVRGRDQGDQARDDGGLQHLAQAGGQLLRPLTSTAATPECHWRMVSDNKTQKYFSHSNQIFSPFSSWQGSGLCLHHGTHGGGGRGRGARHVLPDGAAEPWPAPAARCSWRWILASDWSTAWILTCDWLMQIHFFLSCDIIIDNSDTGASSSYCEARWGRKHQ